MTFDLGLTGSIGMGKSTAAHTFEKLGCGIWDADAAVHRLYAVGGAAVAQIGNAHPAAIKDNAVDREVLKTWIRDDPRALSQIEGIVHPLVRSDREAFRSTSPAKIRVYDIPLLFETQAQAEFDAVACVFVNAEIQKQRVLARGTMTVAMFDAILAKQWDISRKMELSDFLIPTDTIAIMEEAVRDILSEIEDPNPHA